MFVITDAERCGARLVPFDPLPAISRPSQVEFFCRIHPYFRCLLLSLLLLLPLLLLLSISCYCRSFFLTERCLTSVIIIFEVNNPLLLYCYIITAL
jgi:hypothetical protein